MVFGCRWQAAIDLGKWRRAIREGRCEFDIRGYSHIFVPTTSDSADCTDVSEVPGAPNAFQETYGRPALKKLLQAYWQNQDTRDQRREAGADYLVCRSRTGNGPAAAGRICPSGHNRHARHVLARKPQLPRLQKARRQIPKRRAGLSPMHSRMGRPK